MTTIFTQKRKRGLLIAFGVLFLALYSAFWVVYFAKPTGVAAAWYDNSWAYRRKLTFNNARQAANLTNFPVLVVLTSDNFNFQQAQTSGADIRFTDSDGTTLLPYEIELYDATNQQARVWVNVPQINATSNTDFIYLYWGNSAATDAQSADNTWNTNYKGVYHLNDNAASTTVTDSSGNGNNITASENTNNGFYQSGGKISGSVLTAGSPTYISNPYGTSTNIAELYPDIVLDSNGFPVIAYTDYTNNDLVLVHCNDKECKGNDESVSVVDSANSTGYYPSIQLDSSGYPMIAYFYSTGTDLKYVHCNDANCSGGDETFSSIDITNATGYYPRMVIDSSGFPVIAYYYATGADLKIVHCGNADCTTGNIINTIDSAAAVGNGLHGNDLVLDSLGYPVISYYDTTNTELKVIHCNDVNCSGGDEATNSPLSLLAKSIGSFTAIELDGTGLPMIAYYNATDLNLEFIHCDDANCAGDETAARVIVDAATTTLYPSMEKNTSGNPIIIGSRYNVYPTVFACADTNCSSSTKTYLALYNQYGGMYPNFRLDANNNIYTVSYNRGKTGDYDAVLYVTNHKLERAYDADFDFGTGSFSVSAWFKTNGQVQKNNILSRYDADQGFKIGLNYAGRACFEIDDDASWGPDDSACSTNSQISTNIDSGNAGNANWHNMVLDASGYPVIAYFDNSTLDLEFIHCNDVNCAGGNETFASLDTTGDVGRTPSIILDASGFPVIAYYDLTNFDLKIIHCGNANCSSGNTINTVDTTGDVGYFPTVKLDSNGYPVIAYYDTTNTAVKLAHCNDANCDGVGESVVTLVNDEDDRVRHGTESLQLDSNGYPIVVYTDITNYDLKLIHCNDINCDGVGETKTTVESANSVGDFASMKLDANGFPVIVHFDASFLNLRVVHCGNANCSSGNSANAINSINSGDAGYYGIDIELNASGNPILLSTSLANWSTILTVCNDANCAGGDETNSLIREGTYNYLFHSLALDSNSYPIISYSRDGYDLSLIHMTNGTTYTETANYDDSTWHHLVAVKNGTSSITLYIDGVSVGSDTSLAATGTLTSNSATLNLAEEITSTLSNNNWSGYLDEVEIDNTARSAAWVAAQYLSESNAFINVSDVELQGTPLAYWKMDEGYGTVAYDSTANAHNGTVSGATWQTEDQCISGKCLSFDGTNDVVTVGNTVAGVQSVSFWVKPITTTEQFIDLNGSAYIQSSSGAVSATGFTSPTYYIDGQATTSPTVSANQWHHITVTTGTAISASAIKIGQISTNYGQGYIDEIKLFSYARTAAQVKADYNAHKSRAGNVKGTSVSFGGLNPDIVGPLSEGLVGYWKTDEATWSGTLAEVIDSSGNGNHGQAAGATGGKAYPTGGKFGNGGFFDGVDDYVELPSVNPTSAITVSAWVKSSSATGYRGFWQIVSKYSAYILGTSSAGSKAMCFIIYNGVNWYDYANCYTVSNPDAWHHFVGTYDSATSTERIYVDGVLQNSKSVSGSIYNDTGVIHVGHREADAMGSSNHFSGNVDDVRIYNRALSPKEVRDLYNWAPGPTGYYDFEEASTGTLNDKSGNGISGTDTGTVSTTGKFGKARQYNGSTDTTAITDNDSYNDFAYNKDFAVSFWMYNGSGNANGDGIVEKWNGTGGYPYVFRFNSSNGVTFARYDGTNNPSIAVSTNINDNKWHFITGLKDGSNLKLFIDGVLISTATDTTTGTTTNTSGIYLGSRGGTGSWWAGKIDEVKVYNYARTAKQIVEDMNAGHPAVGSPVGSAVGYWNFDEGYGATANNTGNGGPALNGTITNAIWSNNGKFGKTLNFDGNGDYVTVADDPALDMGNMTISAWIKTGTSTTQYISERNNNTYYFATGASSNKLCFYINGVAATWTCSTKSVTDNIWHYVAGTWDGTNKILYIDGVLDTSATGTGGNIGNAAVGINIGYRNNGGTPIGYFNGLIDEVKIYNYALTSDEIKLDYNRGAAQVLGTLSDTSNFTGGSVASSSATAAYCIPGSSDSCAAPVGEWNFEEKTGQTTNDMSGNGNSGTLGSSSGADANDPSWTTGKIGTALSFDGSNDYVDLGTTVGNYTDTFSVSAWVKTSTKNTRIFSRRETTNGTQYDLYLNAGNGYASFYDGTTEYPGTTVVTNGKWHYLTWVFNGASSKIYVDGRPETTFTASITQRSVSTLIGALNKPSPAGVMNGTIDQVRIYNYVRTPAQIAWDYNRGGPVGWWKFDECQGTVANDSSGNGLSGTIASAASLGTCMSSAGDMWKDGATGKRNSSLDFDNTVSDNVQVADNTLLRITDELSVCAWVKSNGGSTSIGIFEKTVGDNVNTSYLLFGETASYKWRVKDTTGTQTLSSLTTLSTLQNTWAHVCGTFSKSNNGAAVIYINGKSDNSTNFRATSLSTGAGTSYIGALGKSGGVNIYPYSGQIDDVRVYNYALTAQQVKMILNDGAVRFGPSTGSP